LGRTLPFPAQAGDRTATAAPTPDAKRDTGKPAVTAEPPKPPANPEATLLMARAKLLLAEGDVGAARAVLERAAETGSAPALFVLAETYDPAVLSAWGTVGTQSDVSKAQQLYAKALAGGVEEAKARLQKLP
jgi:hypothetical protein